MAKFAVVMGALLVALAGCGGEVPPAGAGYVGAAGDEPLGSRGQEDEPTGGFAIGGSGTATVSGTVWAPGNAPGQVPAGEEIPIFGALVRVMTEAPEPNPDGVYCEQCVEVTGALARTAHKGQFSIPNVASGERWLVVEKGQFRLQTRITIAEGETLELPAELTTLPSVHDPDEGRWVPRIAVATGEFDAIQDVLGKMGIGGVSTLGNFTPGPGDSRIDFYTNGGRSDLRTAGTLADLVRDPELLAQYHIVFVPCAAGSNGSALTEQETLRNVRDYVAAGGKLYVTDWSGEWHDNVFPEQVELGPSDLLQEDLPPEFALPPVDTPASAYDRDSDTWDTSQFGSADGTPYDSEAAEVVDPDMFAWLDGQYGPAPDSGSLIDYRANGFRVVDNWNTIQSLTTVEVGRDEQGDPVMDMPYAYVIGGVGWGQARNPLTVTYEPAGCGQVLFSTYHTTETSHVGLVPQERILLYLIMEIGVCKLGPVAII